MNSDKGSSGFSFMNRAASGSHALVLSILASWPNSSPTLISSRYLIFNGSNPEMRAASFRPPTISFASNSLDRAIPATVLGIFRPMSINSASFWNS